MVQRLAYLAFTEEAGVRLPVTENLFASSKHIKIHDLVGASLIRPTSVQIRFSTTKPAFHVTVAWRDLTRIIWSYRNNIEAIALE
jgi:hypothetical protein